MAQVVNANIIQLRAVANASPRVLQIGDVLPVNPTDDHVRVGGDSWQSAQNGPSCTWQGYAPRTGFGVWKLHPLVGDKIPLQSLYLAQAASR